MYSRRETVTCICTAIEKKESQAKMIWMICTMCMCLSHHWFSRLVIRVSGAAGYNQLDCTNLLSIYENATHFETEVIKLEPANVGYMRWLLTGFQIYSICGNIGELPQKFPHILCLSEWAELDELSFISKFAKTIDPLDTNLENDRLKVHMNIVHFY